MNGEPSLGERRKNGLKIQKVSMFDYEPDFADCCDVLGTTAQVEANKDGWLGQQGANNGNAANHNPAIPRTL